MDFDKPIPRATPTTQPFWDGLNEGQVRIQKCGECESWVFYPRSHCPTCLSTMLRWFDISGDAVLYTFTVTHQPTAPQFADEVPQKLAVVELAEGVRMTTTLVNVDEADIKIGMRLKPFFDRVAEDVTMLRFEPA